MNKKHLWSLIVSSLVACVAFTACNDDDDGNDSDTNVNPVPTNTKRLKGLTFIRDGNRFTETYNFEYDSKGRIIKATRNSDAITVIQSHSYVYLDSKIIENDDEWGLEGTYILSNDRIVERENRLGKHSISYKYDSNGYLIERNDELGDTETRTYSWENGNIIKCFRTMKDGSKTSTYSYTNLSSSLLPWPILREYFIWTGFLPAEFILGIQGYFGGQLYNLPSKETVISSKGFTTSYSYDYVVEQGVVTKLVVQYQGSTELDNGIWTFTWE